MHEVVPLELGSSPVLNPGCAASDTMPGTAAHAAITVRMQGYSIEIADGASEDAIRNTHLALGSMMSLFDKEEVMRSYIKSERYEAEQDKAKRTAIHLLKLGKMSLEDIAEATELSLDIVKELESQSMQLA